MTEPLNVEPVGCWSPGLTSAIRALSLPNRPPTEADAPPVSTFPMTKAARAALRTWCDSHKPVVSPQRRRELTYGK